MLCELCGADAPRTEPAVIDGVSLSVCPNCARFGAAPSGREEPAAPTRVSRAIQRRRRRMTARDVYEGQSDVLVRDYPRRISQARSRRGQKQEELARAINEKTSVINKLEKGEMRPDDGLTAKLERELGIRLREALEDGAPSRKTSSTQGVTIGDLLQGSKE